MRLLHTQTLKLSEFNEKNRPRYAILSHTWGDDEFVFSDFEKHDRRSSPGWTKIVKCCEIAAADGWDYAWVDTCCIDKSSSAELTEAINSMWKWYQDSEICYVHLADCYISDGIRELPNSRWFTRGWTLQELLAPERVLFYDAEWKEIGSRSYLQHDISRICRIAPSYLTDSTAASVATKMSWASRRQTTREEDLAYSLLGLFDINMPLIYGEGSKAFFRLQSVIIRSSTDQSIFAWTLDMKDVDKYTGKFVETGMLADSVSCFGDSGDVVPKHFQGLPQMPYQMTNHGLQIEFGCVEPSGNTLPNVLQCLELSVPRLRSLAAEEYDKVQFAELIKSWYDSYQDGNSGLWLIMLPCVVGTHDRQPIALMLQRSPQGIFTKINTYSIWNFKEHWLTERSTLRLESKSFVIANVHRLPKSFVPAFCEHAFIEIGSALQHKVNDTGKRYLKPLNLDPKCEDQWRQDEVSITLESSLEIDLKDGPRLYIFFNALTREWTLRPQFLSVDRTSRAVLGDTDNYMLPYGDTHQILISTRRKNCKPPRTDNDSDLGNGAVPKRFNRDEYRFVIRLDLRPTPKTEVPNPQLESRDYYIPSPATAHKKAKTPFSKSGLQIQSPFAHNAENPSTTSNS